MNTARHPVRVVPVEMIAAAPAAAPHLTYRGGPILSSVGVSVLYWGDAWTQGQQAQLASQLDAFFDFVLTSPLMDQLAEYDTPSAAAGHGSRLGSTQVSGSPQPNLADADVRQLIQDQISGGSLPTSDASTLYFVFLPPAVTVSMDGGASCQAFCGYHDAIDGQIFYAVMPYLDCGGCMHGMSVLDALTVASSHELCEAITDPIPGQGWYDQANGEIGDICAWQTKRIGSYAVQLEWSNRQGACV